MILLGVIIRKKNIIDSQGGKQISSMIVNITAPALIIKAMVNQTVLSKMEIVTILGFAFILYLFLVAFGVIATKWLPINPDDRGIYQFMMIFSNVGFMGFPVLKAAFGDVAIFYAAIFNIPFYLLIYTIGPYMTAGKSHRDEVKINLMNIFNSGIIAVIIGLIIYWFAIPIPGPIKDVIGMTGDMTTPLAMIMIGHAIAESSLKQVFGNPLLYLYVVLKLLVIPIGLLYILKAIGVEGLLLGVPVVIVGMPIATNAVILTKKYHGNERLASEGVLLTTLLSMFTIPLLIFLLYN